MKVNLSPWQILSKYFPSHLQRGVIVTTVHGILEFHQVRFHPLLPPCLPAGKYCGQEFFIATPSISRYVSISHTLLGLLLLILVSETSLCVSPYLLHPSNVFTDCKFVDKVKYSLFCCQLFVKESTNMLSLLSCTQQLICFMLGQGLSNLGEN